ncbi:MAG: alpha/beta hydrolase [Hyphomonas sp.]
MTDPHFEFVKTNGVTLRVATAGDGPLVVLVHGFPESWYSWRHQIKALSEAGYRVAAPDVRGYGESERPEAIDAYDLESLTGDIAGVAEALSPGEKAVVVGHDWGAPIAWNTARLHTDRFRAVAGLSVPYTPMGDVMFLDMVHKVFTERGLFFYQVYFQDVGPPEAELEPILPQPSAGSTMPFPAMRRMAPGRWTRSMATRCCTACRSRQCRCHG